MPDENDALIESFVEEANEGLANIENDLLAIEEAGAEIDHELVNTVFRCIHSIKGSSGFLGLTNIGTLAHEMENILNLIRNDELIPNSKIIDALLQSADALREMINNVKESNDMDISTYIDLLKNSLNDENESSDNNIDKHEQQEDIEDIPDRELDLELPNGDLAFMMIPQRELVLRQRQGNNIYIIDADLIGEIQENGLTPTDFLKKLYDLGEIIDSYIGTAGLSNLDAELPDALPFRVLFASKLSADELSEKTKVAKEHIYLIATPEQTDWDAKDNTDGNDIKQDKDISATQNANSQNTNEQNTQSQGTEAEQANSQASDTQAQKAETDKTQVQAKPTDNKSTDKQTDSAAQSSDKKEKSKPSQPAKSSHTQDTSVRVHVTLLDTLMTLAGELVLGRNQLLQIASTQDMRNLEAITAKIDQVTSELQEAIMQTRLQPVANVFNKFPRLIRDISNKLGKKCELIIEGKEVELDKTIIESIGDPLTHMIRNSMDHGIETPEERKAKGKNPVGTILLSASHQGGKVNIRVQDDGAGIDAEKLKQKAIEKGILTPEQAAEMSNRDAVNLIFHPGFSTAEKVTDVSGRGVGMDVVKTNIEKLGGSIEIETEVDKGTTFDIKLPLTLAIVPALIVYAGRDRYAIPQVNIDELVRIKPTEIKDKINKIKDIEVLRLRGALLPLVRLSKVLGKEQANDESETKEALNVIVVESGSIRYGLIVDGLPDSEEIVVKPLGRHLKSCNCFAGATILGNGTIALILDIGGIALKSNLNNTTTEQIEKEAAAVDQAGDCKLTVLLFTNAPHEQFAIPMNLISRIEKIKREQIDSVGGKPVLQYRGQSLPLIKLEDCITAAPMEQTEELFVLVFESYGKELGLIIPRLIDIRNVQVNFDDDTFLEPGVIGATIINNKTTRMIDIYSLGSGAVNTGEHPVSLIMPENELDNIKDVSGASDSTEDTPVVIKEEKQPTILVAEDSGFFRKQMIGLLESQGYKVVGCEDGQIAWNTLKHSPDKFDLVVTDIEMPNMNGYDLAECIKKDPKTQSIPIIAVTSLAGEEEVARGKKAGIDDYQIKLDKDTLLESIKNFLQGSEVNAG